MTHAINSSTSLLSINYITRTHTQMRKSPRGEKESEKGMTETERKKEQKGKSKKKIEKRETLFQKINKK